MNTEMIGIVGGYGSIGCHLARELVATTPHAVLIGGRSADKAKALADELGSRAHWAQIDINDRQSLDAFCCRCGLVINCAGPSRVILDKVALAALRSCAHYIDAGGEKALSELLSRRIQGIREDGLSFILDAGVYPGLSAVFPSYIADTQLDTVDETELFFYFGGSQLSLNSAWECVRHFNGCERGVPHYEDGQMISGKSQPRHVELPMPCGSVYAHPTFMEELRQLAVRYNMHSLHAYLVPSESTLRALIAAKGGIFLTEEEELQAAERLVAATKEDMGPPCALYHVVMKGTRDGVSGTVRGTLFYEGDSMRFVALVLAAAAGLILEGRTAPGVAFLGEGVDAVQMMALLNGVLSVKIDRDGWT